MGQVDPKCSELVEVNRYVVGGIGWNLLMLANKSPANDRLPPIRGLQRVSCVKDRCHVILVRTTKISTGHRNYF